jgi:mRNA-degrading endonuclease HigB of HigAB toxin-antitoxin module
LREKYTRQELVELAQKYEDISEEISSLENVMRETTFEQAADQKSVNAE